MDGMGSMDDMNSMGSMDDMNGMGSMDGMDGMDGLKGMDGMDVWRLWMVWTARMVCTIWKVWMVRRHSASASAQFRIFSTLMNLVLKAIIC